MNSFYLSLPRERIDILLCVDLHEIHGNNEG
jgi:hypothetical protein